MCPPSARDDSGNLALTAHTVPPLSDLHICVYPQKNAENEFALVGRMSP